MMLKLNDKSIRAVYVDTETEEVCIVHNDDKYAKHIQRGMAIPENVLDGDENIIKG
jgi:hypothetical protein